MKTSQIHIILLSVLLGLTGFPALLFGQLSPSDYSYPNNHLPWFTIESEHFRVHFQEGTHHSAQQGNQIAEKIYPEITELYDYEPDTKIDIVLNDRQDNSNGAAYFFDNQIEIWVPSLDTPLRGTHDWLWDVITHEFTHIIQLQSAMKKDRQIPAIYFQWLSYSDVRRPDVLYGYPKGLITYPFASVNVPVWLAEGIAQYQRSYLYYDFWDSHRDMLLRTAVLSDDIINFEEMGIFGSKNALERERIYNQGFAFTTFLADKFGENVLANISKALGQQGVFSADKAIKQATGTSGKGLFEEFMRASQFAYQQATETLSFTVTESVQKEGFFNFYPKISPSEDRIAYLSNKNHLGANTQLFIEEPADSLASGHAINIGPVKNPDKNHDSLSDQEPAIKRIRSVYSFSPDGESVAFSRQKLNSYGERYNDLFIYNLETHKEKRLTHSQRLSSPAWHSSEEKLLAVQQMGASTNIVEVDLQNTEVTPLTDFVEGEQVYTPSWHPNGNIFFFSYSDNISRDIYRYNNSGQIEPVLQDSLTDYRDPFIDAKGEYLYYAADSDGVFNIYRTSLIENKATPQKLTSVIGGAFMPHVKDSTLLFAEFTAEGYKISSVDITELNNIDKTETGYRQAVSDIFKIPDSKDLKNQTKFEDDSSLTYSLPEDLASSDSLIINHADGSTHSNITLRRHENSFTSFSFFPVIRFDNYSKRYGSNSRLLTAARWGDLGRNLLRDIKLGTYISSREVTDQLDFFGGALFGFASRSSDGIGDFFSPQRLTDLDRDLFLTTEYQGLPFIKKRWSPIVSVELNSLRRNVSNGLAIEEFPCTACLPDTTHADIAYNIWEANISFRSKLNNNSMVEIGAGYSPYRVETEGFFSQELQQFIPASSSEYFRGTSFTATYVYEDFIPYPNRDVSPVGLRTMLRYRYEPSKLLDSYDIEDGTLSPVYQSVRNHSLETTLNWGISVNNSATVNLYSRGFSYLNNPDDFFYLDYIGGFTGMRSYPFFAIGGNTTAFAQLSYNFPVLRNINKQVGRHTLDKLFLRIFTEAGNGWNSPMEIGGNLKTGLGTEIRFAFNSYYLFPLKLFISGTYGFNKFDVTLPDEFITESSGRSVWYGNQPIFHFGLTFDFNIRNE